MIWRLLLIMMLFSSCRYNAFVKRRYTKGYFVSAHGKAPDIKAHTTKKEVLNTSEKSDMVFVKPVVSPVTSALQLKEEKEKAHLKTTEASKSRTELSAHPEFKSLKVAPEKKRFYKKNNDSFQRVGDIILYVLGFFVMTFFYTMILLSGSPGNVNLRVVIIIAAVMALITVTTGIRFI